MPRPSQPLLSHEGVVTAAVKIIDTEGLDALSLPRLARELNVRAPSIYYHFANKEEILEAVARAIVLETPRPRDRSPENWIEYFVTQSLNFRRTILNHAKAAPILLRYPPRDVLARVYDRSAAFLIEVGVPDELHVLILDGLDKLTLGAALTEAMKKPRDRSKIFPHADPEEEPNLARALKANTRSPEELWAESVRTFLRGVTEDHGTRKRRR
ncbi:TetR family transcriptional regulator [Amycolatopsis sp. K13G38]|uniref:TetR family transcriptional regulator n=1 Tax=Amycolatopsis acididurans TaxID=2724524 RepID=A0ABX1JAE4_9PSEU|nr:TetR family transcriptional regulator [Amycolatopsis acididurans]NKQ56757.1 TetR family transcriptional regulator [Amycolatopsis acididurans]